jgi:hypothetical protein
MMISHSIAQQLGQLLSGSCFLCWCQSQRFAHRHSRGDGFGDLLRGSAARSKDQDRRKLRPDRASDHSRPEIVRLHELRVWQPMEICLFERDRSLSMFDQNGVAPDALQPRDNILWVGHAAAQK